MGQILRFINFVCLATFVGLFTACGSTSTSTPGATTGSSGSGSGSTGSGSGSGSSGSGGSGGSGSGSGSSSSFVAYAYTASASEIRAYGVNSDGSLTAASGSPYAASLSKENIVTNGGNLYTIDASQSNLNIYSIDRSSSSLNLAATTSAITGDPNSGDIAWGLSLDHTGSSLYVDVGIPTEQGGVNVFTVGSGSTAQQTQYLQGAVNSPSPFVFSPNNQYAYYFECSARDEGVFGLARASSGTLSPLSFNNVAGPTGNSGEAFCPEGMAASAKGYLAILWFPFAYASAGQVGNESYVVIYTINSDGTLSPVSNSQVKTASSDQNHVALNFDPTGTSLAVAGDGGVQTYSLNGSGMLTPVSAPLSAGVIFQNVAWDNSGHVFATSSTQLYVYNSTSGVLTPAAGSPNAGDQNLAVLPLR